MIIVSYISGILFALHIFSSDFCVVTSQTMASLLIKEETLKADSLGSVLYVQKVKSVNKQRCFGIPSPPLFRGCEDGQGTDQA